MYVNYYFIVILKVKNLTVNAIAASNIIKSIDDTMRYRERRTCGFFPQNLVKDIPLTNSGMPLCQKVTSVDA